jgi:hypothetical protein
MPKDRSNLNNSELRNREGGEEEEESDHDIPLDDYTQVVKETQELGGEVIVILFI